MQTTVSTLRVFVFYMPSIDYFRVIDAHYSHLIVFESVAKYVTESDITLEAVQHYWTLSDRVIGSSKQLHQELSTRYDQCSTIITTLACQFIFV